MPVFVLKMEKEVSLFLKIFQNMLPHVYKTEFLHENK